ncbi:hypothetical protein T459_34771 [Capsicum annuum]|uniref:R13L1/DRL21-like LRR repeat region domain-containing protein n=1 Tax=Capsicum annuum TaxID=4072 RepID=A0A2G2XV25_CAPAN|nr:hypothetical protein T459_34771 [Capsicum annuum]
MSYSMGGGGDFEKLKPLSKTQQLRTLLPISFRCHKLSKRVLHNILPSLRSLRALSLSHHGIVELPNDLFIKLKLLRFLDLSRTEIKKLPDSICALYNLETLLLSSCYFLEELPLQIEKLINLRHLDISDTSHLKMPLHLSKLKSLQVLVGAKFLLGGWRTEDFGEAHYLYGSLSILALQNLVDGREAQMAKMREKNHVENLLLEWNESSADNSQTERDILDELRPHTNIKELKISSYRGTQFPNWLADHSFLKLVKLSLSYCKDCFSLPALGQLPCLKFLSIREMHRITEAYCPKLVGKFPENLCSLTNLRISGCPEPNLETPIQLSSLKWFEVDGSPKAGVVFDEAEVFTSQLEGMKQIEELDISDCNSLTSLPTGTLPSTLKTLRMYRSRKFKLKTSVGDMISNMFLEELALGGCDSISSPELVVPRARTLRVWCFQNVTRFLIPNGTETHMTSLIISECKKLKRLRERMQELLPSLKELRLPYCPEIDSFPDGGLPFSLQLLWIRDCEKLVNDRTEWCLQRLHSLRELYIRDSGSDDEILHSLPTEGLRHLTSLQRLQIYSCHQLQSLPESGFPSSLSKLTITDCPNLQSLEESALSSSLSKLTITDCPNLHSLPVKGMPSSLSELSIRNCSLLKPLVEFDKGEYWPEIAYIPEIYIGVTIFQGESECL